MGLFGRIFGTSDPAPKKRSTEAPQTAGARPPQTGNGVSVFISSRMKELSAERALLYDLIPKLNLDPLELRPWVFEAKDGAPSSSQAIRDVYLNALQRSALYIGVLGDEYGEWTIDEFNQATRWGIDRHLYIKGSPSQKRDRRLEVFLERWTDVESGITARYFSGRDELSQGVAHSLETWAIEQALPRPAGVTAQLVASPDQIPNLPKQLFGRDELVQTILKGLKPAAPALVCGFAGTGKSAIAAKVCEAWLASTGKPALWLRCGFARPEELVAAIARSFRRDYQPHSLSTGEHLELLATCLKEVPDALLVLDDCWNGEALFSILSAVQSGSPVLVTARQRYPLDVIHEIDSLPRTAALELLSGSSGTNYQGHKEASLLCEALCDHAFSIEIAGRALKVQQRTPAELLRQVSVAPHDLTTPLSFSERSRRSVKSLLNVSLDALNARQQLSFRAFGAFFAPALTAEMLHQFLSCSIFWGDSKLTLPVVGHNSEKQDDTVALLRGLEEHNLVKRISSRESPLSHITISMEGGKMEVKPQVDKLLPIEVYRVHDLAYSFARSKATAEERQKALDVTLSTTFFYGATDQVMFDILRPELDNFMGAASWAMSSGKPHYAERLAEMLGCDGQLLQSQGLSDHALKLLEFAKRSAEKRHDADAASRHSLQAAHVNMRLGRLDEAGKVYQAMLDRARANGDAAHEMAALASLGGLHLQTDDYEKAERFSRQAMALARQLNKTNVEADLLGNIGAILASAGKSEEATALLKEAVRLHSAQENPRAHATDLLHLGNLRQEAKDWAAAAEYFAKATPLAKRSGNIEMIARALHGLGRSQMELGQTDAARDSIAQARTHLESIGQHAMVEACDRLLYDERLWDAETTFNIAAQFWQDGNLEKAESLYRRAIKMGIGDAANNLGALLQRQTRMEEAREAFRQGIELKSGTAAINLGLSFEREGRIAEAEDAFRTSLKLGTASAAAYLGAMLFRQGRTKEAETTLRQGVEAGVGEAAYNLGMVLANMKRPEEAKAAYRKAIALGSGDAAANLAATLLGEGAEDEAFNLFSEGVKLGSGLAAANLGAIHFQKGRQELAEKCWRDGVSLRNGVAARYLGALLREHGRLREAETVFRTGNELGDSECTEQLRSLQAELRNSTK